MGSKAVRNESSCDCNRKGVLYVKMRKNQLLALLLAMVVALSCMQMPAMAASDVPADSGPIESAFTDAAFLQAVREIVGKTNGEHIYRLDVENITKLEVVELDIENLDGIECFAALEELHCNYNKIRRLDLSHNPNLKELYCWVNDFPMLDLSHNPDLEILDCSYNMDLVSIDISCCTKLRVMECNYTGLESLDVRNNANLTRLVCFGSYLTELDLSNNKLLETLDTWDTCLEQLDLSNNTELTYLDCSYNLLTSP